MKTKLIILVLAICSFYNGNAAIETTGHSTSDAGSDCCTAESVLGAECSICKGACAGDIKCSGGLISADCGCAGSAGITNLPAQLNQDMIDYLDDYKAYLNQLGEDNLASLADNVIDAVQSQDQTAYINAENQYMDEFDQLDSNIQASINNWIDQNSVY